MNMQISKEIYEAELALCRSHFQKKGCCKWGKCSDCGVLPLLAKLGNGELLETKELVEEFKNQVFN